jgi:hypothetical protein
MFVRRTLEEFRAAKELVASGASLTSIAAELGIPYSTIRHWRDADGPPTTMVRPSHEGWRPPCPATYAYLLGVYLGDGCIGQTSPGAAQLTITLDARYRGVVAEVEQAIRTCMPALHVGSCPGPGIVKVYASHPAWLAAFPQHGPGRKHTRQIQLAEWQTAITREHPKPLLRGFIHSDGSRCANRFMTALPSGRVAEYSYDRYFFTNYSADIRRIFCEHCELLGIRWTQSSFKNISIADRQSVAILDAFVGPKS